MQVVQVKIDRFIYIFIVGIQTSLNERFLGCVGA